ncbi:MAG: hypothetical protein ACK5ES_06070, partial [Planctomyces sp.]
KSPEVLCVQIWHRENLCPLPFGPKFCSVSPAVLHVVVDSHTSRSGKHRYRARAAARDLLAKV